MTPQERKEIAYDATLYVGKERTAYIKRHTLDPEEIKKIEWLTNRIDDEGW